MSAATEGAFSSADTKEFPAPPSISRDKSFAANQSGISDTLFVFSDTIVIANGAASPIVSLPVSFPENAAFIAAKSITCSVAGAGSSCSCAGSSAISDATSSISSMPVSASSATSPVASSTASSASSTTISSAKVASAATSFSAGAPQPASPMTAINITLNIHFLLNNSLHQSLFQQNYSFTHPASSRSHHDKSSAWSCRRQYKYFPR